MELSQDNIKEILVNFLDSVRDYVAESSTDIGVDERNSEEFVDIYLEYAEDYPEEYPASLVELIKSEKNDN